MPFISIPPRRQADPLPPKVGELGYEPSRSPVMVQIPAREELVLPARHPADRDEAASQTAATQPPSTPPSTSPTPTPAASQNQAPSIKKSWTKRLSVGGISPLTILRIFILLAFLGGTGAAWGITIQRFGSIKNPNLFGSSDNNSGTSDNSGGDSNSNNGDDSQDSSGFNPAAFSSLVIIHISFTIVSLVELLFLERSIFHARAERYIHVHGMSRRTVLAAASMGIAPWNRPPLPTYAAALAETGVGTGDVEDNLIAIPPPPAYGNTRGSVLLLAGHLRESLLRNIARNSQQSNQSGSSRPNSRSTPTNNRGEANGRSSIPTPRELEEGTRSRPLSYDASEEMDNAKRARDLEVALSRLETRSSEGAEGPNTQPKQAK